MTYPAGGYPDTPPPGGNDPTGWNAGGPPGQPNPYDQHDDRGTSGIEYTFDQPQNDPYAQQSPTYGPPQGSGPYTPQPMSGVPMSPGPQGPPLPPQGVPQQLPPPPTPSKGPLIAGIAVGAAVLIGLAIVIVVSMDKPKEPSADPTDPAPTVTEQQPSPTEDVTPTDEAPSGDRLSYTEYAHDWDFAFDGVELSATYQNGWDYEDCSAVETEGALTALGCEYAFEVTHRAEDDQLYLTTLVLSMPDETTATQVAKDKAIVDGDFALQSESSLSDYSYGKWRTNSGSHFVVLTICTATDQVSEEKADEYLDNRAWDIAAALLWT